MYATSTPHRSARWALVFALALCIAPTAADAQKVITKSSTKDIAKIITSMGLEVMETKEDAKHPSVKFELGGYPVVLILANENTDAQLYIGFADLKISPEKANEWNRDHRFSRAYRDNDGDAVLEADLDFTGGVTEANIKAWVRIFRDLLIDYAKFARESGG